MKEHTLAKGGFASIDMRRKGDIAYLVVTHGEFWSWGDWVVSLTLIRVLARFCKHKSLDACAFPLLKEVEPLPPSPSRSTVFFTLA